MKTGCRRLRRPLQCAAVLDMDRRADNVGVLPWCASARRRLRHGGSSPAHLNVPFGTVRGIATRPDVSLCLSEGTMFSHRAPAASVRRVKRA